MSGLPGQKSAKPDWIPARYREDWLTGLDGRSKTALALRARLSSLEAELGGPDRLSYQRRSLCRRAIHLEARIEAMELAHAQGRLTEAGPYVVAINSLIGLFRTLGLNRRAKDVTLVEYLSQRELEATKPEGRAQ